MLDTIWFWRLVWAVWLGWFLVWEIIALSHPMSGDTLSEQIWHLRDTLSGNVWSLFFCLFIALLVWLVIHFGWQKSGG
ncbi:MAG: hypothetical protein WC977_13260 [Anaerovoracaceae bacterium]